MIVLVNWNLIFLRVSLVCWNFIESLLLRRFHFISFSLHKKMEAVIYCYWHSRTSFISYPHDLKLEEVKPEILLVLIRFLSLLLQMNQFVLSYWKCVYRFQFSSLCGRIYSFFKGLFYLQTRANVLCVHNLLSQNLWLLVGTCLMLVKTMLRILNNYVLLLFSITAFMPWWYSEKRVRRPFFKNRSSIFIPKVIQNFNY